MDKYEVLANALCEMIDEIAATHSSEKEKCRNRMKCRIENPAIVKVIFNDPCTVVFWSDGTKTVVKCGKDDVFSKETGLAMAICKYVYGNSGKYNDVLNHWIENGEDATAK